MMNGNIEEIQRIIYLLSAGINNELTVQEETELRSWLADKPENQYLFDQMMNETYRKSILDQWKPDTAENWLKRIKEKMVQQKRFAI